MDLGEAISRIRDIGRSAEGKEACGCLVRDGSGGLLMLPGRNVAAKPVDEFEVDRATMLRSYRSKGLEWIYHTHLRDVIPSERDHRACDRLGIPFLIVSLEAGHTLLYPDALWSRLTGKSWTLGSRDCVALVRDYFFSEHGLDLPPYEVPPEWPPRTDYFAALAESWGFEPISPDERRRSDVLAIRLSWPRPNHLAVVLDDERILHHPQDRLSLSEPLKPYLRRCSVAYRYRNLGRI